MNPYEKIIKTMREQGKKNSPEGIILAKMESAQSCIFGNDALQKEDLYIADGLSLKKGDTVAMCQVSEERFLILAKVVEI